VAVHPEPALAGLVLPLIKAAMALYGRRTGAAARESAAPLRDDGDADAGRHGRLARWCACSAWTSRETSRRCQGRPPSSGSRGRTKYCLVLVFGAVSWQLFNLGIMGLIIWVSSLLAGVLIAVLLPLSEVLAVIVLREKFDGTKGIALVLSLWGFVSYLYGENAQRKLEAKKTIAQEAAN